MKFHLEKNKCFFTMKNVLFALPFIFFSACSSDTDNEDNNTKKGKTFTDSRDGQKYRYVQIGEQVWMAENLNYAVEGGKCCGEGGRVFIGWDLNTQPITPITKTLSNAEVQANCTKYGRLYDWVTAMTLPSYCNSNSCATQIQPKHKGICPSGWHIPSYDDWYRLMNYVGGDSAAGRYLKSTSGWYNDGNGTDQYGFSALPGGGGNLDGLFGCGGNSGIWWIAREIDYDNDSYVSRWDMSSADAVYWGATYKSELSSVRCIKD